MNSLWLCFFSVVAIDFNMNGARDGQVGPMPVVATSDVDTLSVSFIWKFFWKNKVTSSKLPKVDTPNGKIEGILDKTVTGRNFFSFEGIPYAQPPVGELRFKEAIPPQKWKGTWKANTKYLCLQYDHFSPPDDQVIGTEDCLFVNVYTPKLDGNLDVIVHIHGGAFIFGAGIAFQPHILLDRDVVYVSLNYRLGPLGFLSTEDDVVPGNNGLKDQILALRWIKENIQYFGGNPNSITITGMSAGGASVHFHLLSPKSKGLFSRAFSMSGCMLNPWVLMENPLERSKELASIVGCSTDNNKQMIDCLRGRPGKQIVSVVRNFQPWLFNPFSPFGAVVDSWSKDPVIPKHPLELLKAGPANDVPWLLSHTSGEGLYPGHDFYPEENLQYIDEHWDEVIPHILHYNYTVSESLKKQVNDLIRNEYFGNENVNRQNFHTLIDVIGDRLFKVDIDKCTRLHAANIKSPVFHYLFDYRGAHSQSEFENGTTGDIGVSHAHDTMYVLKAELDTLSTEEDRSVSKFMVDVFETFAKYGEPKTEIEWPEVSKSITEPIVYLKIASTTDIEDEEYLGNRKFWDSLPFQENERLFTAKTEL